MPDAQYWQVANELKEHFDAFAETFRGEIWRDVEEREMDAVREHVQNM